MHEYSYYCIFLCLSCIRSVLHFDSRILSLPYLIRSYYGDSYVFLYTVNLMLPWVFNLLFNASHCNLCFLLGIHHAGRLLTALICEYLDWAQLNHTLKVYLPECNLVINQFLSCHSISVFLILLHSVNSHYVAFEWKYFLAGKRLLEDRVERI